MRAGYKQTEVGVIPEDWEVRELGELLPFLTSGSRGWADYYADSGDFFVRITNMSRETIYLDLISAKYVRLPQSESEGQRTRLICGDILVSITADIGIVSFVDESIPTPAYVNQHIALVRISPDVADSRFIAYFLASELSQKRFKAITDTGAKAGMTLNTVRRVLTALPRRQEQTAIAKALADVDAEVSGLERLIAKKRDLKQAAMSQLLTGQTRLPVFSRAWEVKRLAEVGEIRSGGTPSTAQTDFWDGEIPWCTPTDITALLGAKYLSRTNRCITEAGLKASSADVLPERSLIMTSRATIGECAINLTRMTTNQGFKNIIPFEGYDVEFLYYLMGMQRSALIALCGGSTFLEIGKKQLLEFKILVPCDLAEQTAIAAVLSDMDAELTALQAQLDKTRLIKQAMMQDLLTGRIRLPF